jgi:glycerophosphoryl diester phosphodiesterase
MQQATDLIIVPPVIAHRGANIYAPENTLAAFLKAKELGFNWVEFDVMLTADDELVVIHDEELARTTNGKGAVLDYPYHYLQTLDAGSWFDKKFSDAKISTLESVLNFLCDYRLSANIEIKALQNRDEKVVKKVMDIVGQYSKKMVSPPLISSFSENVLRLIRKQSSDCLLGFLMDEWLIDWEVHCDELQCACVNVNQDILTLDRVQAIKSTGRTLLAYTVNSSVRAKELYSWGVDAIFSDCPPEIVEMVAG